MQVQDNCCISGDRARNCIPGKATAWLNGLEVWFKMDTDAEVTAISEATYKKIRSSKTPFEQASKPLYGPTCQSLQVVGQFEGTLSHKALSTTETIFVIRNNLLGLEGLEMVK